MNEEILKRLQNCERFCSSDQTKFASLERRIESIEIKLADFGSKLQKERNPWRMDRDLESEAPLHQKFAEKITGVVGLQEAIDSKQRIVKYTWAILLVFGIVATMFFLYKTTEEYLEEPTATKIVLNVSDQYEIPPIALCPDAWVDAEKALSLGITLDGLKFSLGYINTWPNVQLRNIPKAKNEFLDFYSSQNYTSLFDYYKDVALDLPTVYSQKAFANLTTGVKLSDNSSVLLKRVFMKYEIGNAYSFAPTARTLYTTASAQIKLQDKTNGIFGNSPGLWIQTITDLNFFNERTLPIYVSPFSFNKIVVSARKFSMLNKPEAPCAESKAVSKFYSSMECALNCLNEKYKELIKCRLFDYSFASEANDPSEYCNSFGNSDFQNKSYDEFVSSEQNEDITDACLDTRRCPPKCDRIIYQMSLHWQQKIDNTVHNETKRMTNIFVVNIEHTAKHENGILTLIEVDTYSFTALVNNVGGTLGLFVGATIMTIPQVILFFVEHVCAKRQKEVVGPIALSNY